MSWYCNITNHEDGHKWIEGDIEFACGKNEEKTNWYINENNQVSTSATAGEIDIAWTVLEDYMTHPNFVQDYHNNEHGVNACIALHVLGCADVVEWFNALDDVVDFEPRDYSTMLHVFERVEPYLYKWGPNEDRGRALSRMV